MAQLAGSNRLLILWLIHYNALIWNFSGIVPHIFPTVPSQVLRVTYDRHIVVSFGEELFLNQVTNAPQVVYNANPHDLYTLIMIDPDAPSRSHPQYAQVIILLKCH